MPVPLSSLIEERSKLLRQVVELGDFQPGSISSPTRKDMARNRQISQISMVAIGHSAGGGGPHGGDLSTKPVTLPGANHSPAITPKRIGTASMDR